MQEKGKQAYMRCTDLRSANVVSGLMESSPMPHSLYLEHEAYAISVLIKGELRKLEPNTFVWSKVLDLYSRDVGFEYLS
jgi:hypothetical protein